MGMYRLMEDIIQTFTHKVFFNCLERCVIISAAQSAQYPSEGFLVCIKINRLATYRDCCHCLVELEGEMDVRLFQ